ncbi:MAG TPA: hypothetical protein VFC72_07965 [Corynebacterium sp.]|nr:hypothetical protein [Corynebacterium sp.]
MATTTTYAASLARRILAGAGALSLVPYAIDPDSYLSVLAHGVDEQGRFIVAVTAREAEQTGDAPVRIDGIKKALELDVDILIASIHALAQVTWLEVGEAAPGFGLAPSAEIRLGVLEADTLYVRAPHGTTRCEFAEVLAGADLLEVDALNGLDAREQVARLSDSQLSELLDGVAAGTVSGQLLSEHSRPVCAAHRDRIWVADIDARGLVLLHAGAEQTTTTLLHFAEPVSSLPDLAWALNTLAFQTSAR